LLQKTNPYFIRTVAMNLQTRIPPVAASFPPFEVLSMFSVWGTISFCNLRAFLWSNLCNYYKRKKRNKIL